MTKIEMARVVVQALFNMPGLPPVDNRHVKHAARMFKSDLEHQHTLAATIVARNEKLRAAGVAP